MSGDISAKKVCKCFKWETNLGTIYGRVLPNFFLLRSMKYPSLRKYNKALSAKHIWASQFWCVSVLENNSKFSKVGVFHCSDRSWKLRHFLILWRAYKQNRNKTTQNHPKTPEISCKRAGFQANFPLYCGCALTNACELDQRVGIKTSCLLPGYNERSLCSQTVKNFWNQLVWMRFLAGVVLFEDFFYTEKICHFRWSV